MKKRTIDNRSEHAIQNDILCNISTFEASAFWRNNTGRAWAGEKMRLTPGQHIEVLPGMAIIMNAQPISYGFVGSGDILGCVAGKAISIEVKSAEGDQQDSQIIFERNWKRSGGIYIRARSVDEAMSKLTDAILS